MNLASLTESFLALHQKMRPVDSTFMGYTAHDGRLPPASPDDLAEESAEFAALKASSGRLPAPSDPAERVGLAALRCALNNALLENEERPRIDNPAWYTGEAAFGLIALMLRQPPEGLGEAIAQRVAAMPGFFASGARNLTGASAPRGWIARAKQEASAIDRLLSECLDLHGQARSVPASIREAAVTAVRSFSATLENMPDAAATAGDAHVNQLLREVHAFPFGAAEAQELAEEGFEASKLRLTQKASQLDGRKPWQTQLQELESLHPASADVVHTYERFHEDAMAEADAHGLVTPATEYGLSFSVLPEWAQPVAQDLYFLFYRSPAALQAGSGSPYWIFSSGQDTAAYLRSQNYATIKLTHAVHHGSIGHHTQNTRARSSSVQLGRVAGTDCALGIAMLPGGSLIEGWACYVQELLLEADGFYTPAEELLVEHGKMRNAALCLADLRLHGGTWSLDQVRDFLEREVGTTLARAAAETTRISMFPTGRAMYWLGTEGIRAARRELGGSAREFHDRLLSFGSVPVYAVINELRGINGAAG